MKLLILIISYCILIAKSEKLNDETLDDETCNIDDCSALCTGITSKIDFKTNTTCENNVCNCIFYKHINLPEITDETCENNCLKDFDSMSRIIDDQCYCYEVVAPCNERKCSQECNGYGLCSNGKCECLVDVYSSCDTNTLQNIFRSSSCANTRSDPTMKWLGDDFQIKNVTIKNFYWNIGDVNIGVDSNDLENLDTQQIRDFLDDVVTVQNITIKNFYWNIGDVTINGNTTDIDDKKCPPGCPPPRGGPIPAKCRRCNHCGKNKMVSCDSSMRYFECPPMHNCGYFPDKKCYNDPSGCDCRAFETEYCTTCRRCFLHGSKNCDTTNSCKNCIKRLQNCENNSEIEEEPMEPTEPKETKQTYDDPYFLCKQTCFIKPRPNINKIQIVSHDIKYDI